MKSEPKRFFTQKQKNQLYLKSNGLCVNCSNQLTENNFHADHIIPHSKGGKTILENGQALCKDCNLKKGNKLERNMNNIEFKNDYELREWQNAAFKKLLLKLKVLEKLYEDNKEIKLKDKMITVNVPPGFGKTDFTLLMSIYLYREGFIDQAVAYVPRLNLRGQYEADCYELHNKYIVGNDNELFLEKSNKLPFVENYKYDEQNYFQLGWVSTFPSLVSQPNIHIKSIANKDTLAIIDEAQTVGEDQNNRTYDSKAKKVLDEVVDNAKFVILVTGSRKRSDNSKIPYVKYVKSEDDQNKMIPVFDIERTYRDGVAQKFLRKCIFSMIKGDYKLTIDNGEVKTVAVKNIEDMERVHLAALNEQEFFGEFVDLHVESVIEKKKINNKFCGLITCANIYNAINVKRYIEEKFPNHRVGLAVSKNEDTSDDPIEELELFKNDKYDTLVSVNMVSMGYNLKEIIVVTILTNIRFEEWLLQMVGRGLRVISEIPYEEQITKIICPDDILMNDFRKYMRSEMDEGIRIQEEKADDGVCDEIELDDRPEISADDFKLFNTLKNIWDDENFITEDEQKIFNNLKEMINNGADAWKVSQFLRSIKNNNDNGSEAIVGGDETNKTVEYIKIISTMPTDLTISKQANWISKKIDKDLKSKAFSLPNLFGTKDGNNFIFLNNLILNLVGDSSDKSNLPQQKARLEAWTNILTLLKEQSNSKDMVRLLQSINNHSSRKRINYKDILSEFSRKTLV